ncbi:LysR family transcriptional regulator [Streptomyces sp. NPDC018031]|uniref:LysR family transcriptional regulator n=1 Tax=Streptomyces sp. NPDC018031 TaxID=3365033 RepID=UPI0037B58333
MDLQLRHLRNLCAIADAGSLNRAAIALGLPQPALSRQVRRLEQLLGGPLFERDSCGVRPTPLGTSVLDHADAIVRLSDNLGEQLRGHRVRQRSTVRVGWATSVLHESLLHCLRRLPFGGRLRVVTTDSSRNLAALLRSGEVDLAMRDHCVNEEPFGAPPAGGLPQDGVISDVVWGESPVHLALAATHPLAAAPVITMADLADEDWISVYGADGCHEKLRRLCGAYGFTPRISHDIPLSGPRCEVIRHQGSVALAQALRPVGPGVVCRPVADLTLRVRHSIAFRKDSRFAAQVPLLVEMLSAAFRDLAGPAPAEPRHDRAVRLRPVPADHQTHRPEPPTPKPRTAEPSPEEPTVPETSTSGPRPSEPSAAAAPPVPEPSAPHGSGALVRALAPRPPGATGSRATAGRPAGGPPPHPSCTNR